MTLEVQNLRDLSTIKVATVVTIIGRRLQLRYAGAPNNDTDMFVYCHEESALIHPVGWALSVGHMIDAPDAYLDRCFKREFLELDAREELFNTMKPVAGRQMGLRFQEGMKLEAIDPLNQNQICVATVTKVLMKDYLMIRIDRKPDEDSTTFCCHATSACIAPPGFCEANGIALQPPVDYEGDRFFWYDYIRQQKVVAAPEALFQPMTSSTIPKLSVGMKVEAADLVEPRLVCVATIAQVAGRLVRIHFDGWTDDFEQWMDAASPELYPVGWCELVGYCLEAPKAAAPSPTKMVKKKTKSSSWKTGNWKKKPASNPTKKERSTVIESSQCREAAKSPEETSREVDDGVEMDPQFNKADISTAGGGAKKIPKLIDLNKDQRKEALAGIKIEDWSPTDVAEFLRVNDLAAHSDAFIKEVNISIDIF